jgi:hypothetical protein
MPNDTGARGSDTCTCVAIFAPSIDAASISRVDKPISYILKLERVDCGG